MKTLTPTLSTYLAAPDGLEARILLWITVRNRNTGAAANFGFWNGDDDRSFTINGSSRSYAGAGNMGIPEPLVYRSGLIVGTYSIDVATLAPAIQEALVTYDPRMAPIELHRAFFNASTKVLIEEPMRVFKGQVDEFPTTTPEIGGSAGGSLTMVSSAVFLTRSLSQKKSEATQRLRSDDRFYRWIDVSGSVGASWGSA